MSNPKVQALTCPECGRPLKLRPVVGAKRFARRLECPIHGYKPRTYRCDQIVSLECQTTGYSHQ